MPPSRRPLQSTRSPIAEPAASVPAACIDALTGWQRLVLRRNARFGPDPADVLTEIYEVRGDLDLAWLEMSVNAIIERHVPLRTSYGRARSVAAGSRHRGVTLHEAASDVEANAWRHERNEVVIDPSEPPLLRVDVARLAANRHFLAVSGHEIAFDGWSYGVLLAELSGATSEIGAAAAIVVDQPRERSVDIDDVVGLRRSRAADWPVRRHNDELSGPAARRVVRMPSHLSNVLREQTLAIGAGDLAALLTAGRVAMYVHSGMRHGVAGVPVMGRAPHEEHCIGAFTDMALVDGSIDTAHRLLDLVGDQQARLFRLLDGRAPSLVDVLDAAGLDESAVRVTVTVEPDHQPFALPGLSLEYLPATSRRMRPDFCIVGSRDADGVEIFIDARLDTVGRDGHRLVCAALLETMATIAQRPASTVGSVVARLSDRVEFQNSRIGR